MALRGRFIMTAANRHDVGQVGSASVDRRGSSRRPSGTPPPPGPSPSRERHGSPDNAMWAIAIVGSSSRALRGARPRLRDHRGRLSDAKNHPVEVGLREITMRLRIRGIEPDRLAEARDALFEILRAERLSKRASLSHASYACGSIRLARSLPARFGSTNALISRRDGLAISTCSCRTS